MAKGGGSKLGGGGAVTGGGVQAGSAPIEAPFRKESALGFFRNFHYAKNSVAAESPENAWRVDDTYGINAYRDMDCYVTDGGSTVAVHNGDIVSVCHNPEDKGTKGSDLLAFAVAHGGRKLDAFGKLYRFYTKNGFEPVSWTAFNREYAPHDWRPFRDQQEPVIFYKYTGRSAEAIRQSYGETFQDYTRTHRASADYDAAQAVRDRSL